MVVAKLVLVIPSGALLGLKAVLSLDIDEKILLGEPFKEIRDLHPERAAAFVQVLDHQVSKSFWCSADSGIASLLTGQLPNQEDQGAKAGSKLSVLCPISLPLDD